MRVERSFVRALRGERVGILADVLDEVVDFVDLDIFGHSILRFHKTVARFAAETKALAAP
jgi:hypothetical protein